MLVALYLLGPVAIAIVGQAKSNVYDVKAIIVNPADYTVGADKGGQVSMFEDFDIDYNQQKYLIETRCSGSLMQPKTAICVEKVQED